MNIYKIKESITNAIPFDRKIEEEVTFYKIDKHRYLLFWDGIIERNDIDKILDFILSKTSNDNFHPIRTIIVLGETVDTFEKKDLVYCYMNHTGSSKDVTVFVNFYLLNKKRKQIYKDDSWTFPIGLGYRKIIRKLDRIIRSHITYS